MELESTQTDPLPPIPYQSEPQEKEEVRRHAWMDAAASIYDSLRSNGAQSADHAGDSAVVLVWYLRGWTAAWDIAWAWIQHQDNKAFLGASAADAKKLSDRLTRSIIPMLDEIIQSECESIENRIVAKRARDELAKVNGDNIAS